MEMTLSIVLLALISSALNALFLQLAFDVYRAIAARGRRHRENSGIDAPHFLSHEYSAQRSRQPAHAGADRPLSITIASDAAIDRPYRASQVAMVDTTAEDADLDEPSFTAAYLTAGGAMLIYGAVIFIGAMVVSLVYPDFTTNQTPTTRIIVHLAILLAAFSMTILFFNQALKIRNLRTAYMITLTYYLILSAIALLIYICRPILMA